jgi:hypothetical protein
MCDETAKQRMNCCSPRYPGNQAAETAEQLMNRCSRNCRTDNGAAEHTIHLPDVTFPEGQALKTKKKV